MAHTNVRTASDEPSAVASAAAGAGAYVAGYLLTYAAVLAVGLRRRVTDPDAAWLLGLFEFGQTPDEVGALFYGAHLVGTSTGHLSVDVLGALAEVEPVLYALYAVPPLVLVATGALLGRDRRGGAAAGAKLVLGYLPLAVAGRFVFSVGPEAARPEFATAVVFAGLLFPLLFGAVGGVLSSR